MYKLKEKRKKSKVNVMISKENQMYTKDICKILSKKRANHSIEVAEMCVLLAKLHGEDTDRAYTAGILHDIRKETDREILQIEVSKSVLNPDPVELITPSLWHAVSGAYHIKERYGIDDDEIRGAIRFHTIGCPKMTKLQKILYIADYVSLDRSYEDIEKYRKFALENTLDETVFILLRWSLCDLMNKGSKIPSYSFDAYNYYSEFFTTNKSI